MDAYTASLCAGVLMIAGVMELVTNPAGHSLLRYSGILAAFGFWMLGVRYGYLVYTGDLGRLNLYGTGSIGAIALGRIIACVAVLRR